MGTIEREVPVATSCAKRVQDEGWDAWGIDGVGTFEVTIGLEV